ncbi:hypothetical protein JQM83_13450 [Parabacteroides distasonis]|nr:hypothetical protein [Parabacteroides distasonis]
MNPTLKKILWPLVMLRRSYDNYLKKNNPEKLFSIYHKRSTGTFLNTKNPVTLSDKVAYMSFHTDTSVWSKLADKVRVREYLEECGLKNIAPLLYGVWKSADEIDFSCLPTAFVIKTNNGSATNILVRDKNSANQDDIRKKLQHWLKIDYGYMTCQPHYSRIEPLILAEEFLGDGNVSLIDYKFYCFNGNPMYVQVMTDRSDNTHNMKVSIFDMEWNNHPEYCSTYHEQAIAVKKPVSFSSMIEYARILSKPFPFVRVDFYEIDDAPVFGEMTFTPGFDTVNYKFEIMAGHLITI